MNETRRDYDCIVIGSGPGGYVAAIRASQLGLKAAVIEKDKPGGVCANIGCIPSKALIHLAGTVHSIRALEQVGVTADLSGFDYAAVQKKSRVAAEKLSKGTAYLLKKNNVSYIEATATLAPDNHVALSDGTRLSAKHSIIATGSRPREIPGFPFDEERIISSTGALMLTKLPQRMLILGAGAIGCEFAHVFNAFGVAIQMVEMLDQILPLEDSDTAKVLDASFQKRGIRIATSTKAIGVTATASGLEISLEAARGETSSVTVDTVLVAVGRAPNSEGCGLEAAGVQTEKGYITVGDYYQTSVPGIYAIGDVIPTAQLAHLASKEGEIAVEHMAGKAREPRVDPDTVPNAVYCEPQVASFGPTEAKAKETGRNYEKAVFPYQGVGKATAIGATEGMVKVLYDPDTREILAAHAAGAGATELIHEILLAKKAELLPEDIATMIHAHPTLSEAVMEAMRAAEGWAIHI